MEVAGGNAVFGLSTEGTEVDCLDRAGESRRVWETVGDGCTVWEGLWWWTGSLLERFPAKGLLNVRGGRILDCRWWSTAMALISIYPIWKCTFRTFDYNFERGSVVGSWCIAALSCGGQLVREALLAAID